MAFPLGNVAALRTFRVLRALKTVAVVPGKSVVHGDSLSRSGLGASLTGPRKISNTKFATLFSY